MKNKKLVWIALIIALIAAATFGTNVLTADALSIRGSDVSASENEVKEWAGKMMTNVIENE